MKEITCNARKGRKIPLIECIPIVDDPPHPACVKCNSPRNLLYTPNKTVMLMDKKEDQPKRKPVKAIKETTGNNNDKHDQPSVYVKHLTKLPLSLEDTAYASGDLRSPFFDPHVPDTGLLSSMEQNFEQSNDPLDAISCFLYAHECGVYPPMPVMHYFYKILDKFMTSNGLESLDKLFGFKSGRGQAPLINKYFENARNDKLCEHVFILNKGCKFTIDTSAFLVAEMLAKGIYGRKSPSKFKAITIDRLKHIFHVWKNNKSDSHKNFLVGALHRWRKEQKEEFLQPVKEILKEHSMEKELERLKKMV